MMKHHLQVAAATAVLFGCTPSYAPEDLHGQLVGGPVSPAPDRVAIVWNNWNLRATQGAFASTEEGVLTSFGPRFFFDFTQPPPEAAMQPNGAFEPNGGRLAYGTVVAYRDNNANGKLDPFTYDSPAIDTIVGTSSNFFGTYDGSDGTHFEVRFVEGAPPDAPVGLKEGYNLLLNGQVVDPATEIKVPLRVAAVHNLYVCAGHDNTTDVVTNDMWNRCLGPGPLRVMGGLDLYEGQAGAWIELFSGDEAARITDAEVSVMGQALTLDPEQGIYFYDASSSLGVALNGTNTIIVKRPGQAEQSFYVRLDSDFTITSPEEGASLPWNQPVTLSWTPSAGATEYYVRQSVRFPEGTRGRSGFEPGTSKTYPALSAAPAALVGTTFTVMTLRQTHDDNGTNISGMVYRLRRANFTP